MKTSKAVRLFVAVRFQNTIPGKDNIVIDVLSRMKINALSVSKIQPRADWIQQIRATFQQDVLAQQARNDIES